MPIFKSAYDTTACRGAVLTKIQHALEESVIVNGHQYFKPIKAQMGDFHNPHLCEINGAEERVIIPSFMHPISYKTKEGSSDIFIDVRSTGKCSKDTFVFEVRNIYEYQFIGLYGMLNEFWINDNPKLLLGIASPAMSLYARWISENLTRRFGLDPQTQLTISILSAYFFAGLFTEDRVFDEREQNRVAGLISKSISVNAEVVLDTIDKIEMINSVEELCSSIKTVTGNVRLDDLNPGLLYSVLGNTWFGTNAKELIAVALEFPPAWLLICKTAYLDRTFKNTGIAKLASRDNHQQSDLYIKSLFGLFKHR